MSEEGKIRRIGPEGEEGLNYVDRSMALLFPDKLSSYFVDLSELVNERIKSRVVLNTTNALPHVTLFEARFPLKNIEGVREKVGGIAEKHEPFKVVFGSGSIVAGTVFVDIEKSEPLLDLHNSLVGGLNFLREGLYDETELELPGLSEEMKSNLARYGSLLVREDYRPHVTIARPYEGERYWEALVLVNKELKRISKTEFWVSTVYLVETGTDGVWQECFRRV